MNKSIFCALLAAGLTACAAPPHRGGMQSSAGGDCAAHMEHIKQRHERMPMHAAQGASAPQHGGGMHAAGGDAMKMMGSECKMMEP